MRFLKSYGIAFIILVIIAVWMGSGVIVQGGKGPGKGEREVISLFSEDTGKEGEAAEPAGEDGINPHLAIAERVAEEMGGDEEIRTVRIKTYNIQSMPLKITLRGTTEANSTVTVSAETSGTVDEIPVSKGDHVEVGDLLCKLDQGTRQANVAQAKAALAKAQLDFDTNAKLREKGLAAANTKSPLEAALLSAQAALDQAQAELDRTEIRAKIDGIVQGPVAEVGALLSAGQPCATIVQLDPIKFVASIPQARIGLARAGLPVTIATINGQTAEGKVTFISSSADAATRTFRAEAEFPNPDGRIRDGLTANGTVDVGIMPAHLLPQSVLTLDDDGQLGVRTVDADDKVVFYPVEIVKDTEDGVWVTGLPGEADVITVGQEYVKAGQVVDPQTYDDGAAS